MTDAFTIKKTEGYLLVTFFGQFTVDAAKRTVDAIVAASADEKCANVLFDCRPMIGKLSIMNRFEVAEYAASVIPSSLKIAMLGRFDQILPDKFLENVARNRGMRLALFPDEDQAVEWLRDPEEPKPRGIFRWFAIGALFLFATTL